MEFKFHHVFEKIEHCEKWRDTPLSLSKSKDSLAEKKASLAEKKANYAAKKRHTDLKFLMGGEDTSKMSSPVKAWYMAQRQAILQGVIMASPSSVSNVLAPNAPTPSSASTSSNAAAINGETDDNAASATLQEPIPIDD